MDSDAQNLSRRGPCPDRLRRVIAMAVAAWSLAAVAGVSIAVRYEKTATATAEPPAFWPEDTSLERASDRATLLVFLHPRCPCSRATLDELAVALTHCQGQAETRAVFFGTRREQPESSRGDLWDRAVRIPGLVAVADSDGSEQRRFGARVSGEVFVYHRDGRLAFHGGVTGGRGHAGDNAGRAALEHVLRHGAVDAAAPTFGCELQSPGGFSGNSPVSRSEAQP
jgi:hypothetical protein